MYKITNKKMYILIKLQNRNKKIFYYLINFYKILHIHLVHTTGFWLNGEFLQ